MSTSEITVRIWASCRSDSDYQPIVEWRVHFSGLAYIGTDVRLLIQ